jgi:DNA-binding GntR family transcriptional regulator
MSSSSEERLALTLRTVYNTQAQMSRHFVLESDPGIPAGHQPLSQTVADWLAQRIISGEAAPGERLTEPRIAQLAGVSRSPVREALRILARDGLVEILPRLGAQVAAIGVDDARGLYACRMLLEPSCARLAVEALTPPDVLELDAIRAAMEAAVANEDPRQFLDENIAYFRTLLGHCSNPTLRELVELTWNKSVRYWSIFARLPHYGRGSLLQHALLHGAVRSGDGAVAERADRAILERALAEVVHTLEA